MVMRLQPTGKTRAPVGPRLPPAVRADPRALGREIWGEFCCSLSLTFTQQVELYRCTQTCAADQVPVAVPASHEQVTLPQTAVLSPVTLMSFQ